MYYGLGLLLTLAGFLAANTLASFAAASLARPLVRSLEGSAPERLRLLLALRLFPSAASIVFALGLLLPAYVLFEPHHSGEQPGLTLALVAAAALAIVVAGLRRGLASWRVTGRLEQAWRGTAERVSLPSSALPVYRVRDAFPVVGLVGTLHPRLYVAGQVLEVLTPAELTAVATHEAAHGLAFDNLKRLVLRTAPDVLSLLPAARWLEREWVLASEIAADSHAASGGAASALDLCAALIKVGRLARSGRPVDGAVSQFHDGSDLTVRVQRLVAAAESGRTMHPAPARTGAWIGIGALAATLLAWAPELLRAVHRLAEAAVRWLI